MAWIRMIPEHEATGELKTLYEKLIRSDGIVDNILKIHSLNPPSLRTHYEFYKTVVKGRSGLSRVQREMIAVVVSATNHCHY
ncbi:MAG: peroxidase [Calditrichaeota bacterium]|nr:MAG: peroxidase [Calditrichota bacterium]